MSIILGILITTSAVNAFFAFYSFVLANKAMMAVEAYKLSTHTVQYVDPMAGQEITQALKKDAEDFEDTMDMTYKDFNEIYSKKLSDDFVGIVDPVDFEYEKGKRSY